MEDITRRDMKYWEITTLNFLPRRIIRKIGAEFLAIRFLSKLWDGRSLLSEASLVLEASGERLGVGWVAWAAPLKWSDHQGGRCSPPVVGHHPPPLTLLCTHGQGYGRSPDAAIGVKVYCLCQVDKGQIFALFPPLYLSL